MEVNTHTRGQEMKCDECGDGLVCLECEIPPAARCAGSACDENLLEDTGALCSSCIQDGVNEKANELLGESGVRELTTALEDMIALFVEVDFGELVRLGLAQGIDYVGAVARSKDTLDKWGVYDG